MTPAELMQGAARAQYLTMVEREDIPDCWNDDPELREWWTTALRAALRFIAENADRSDKFREIMNKEYSNGNMDFFDIFQKILTALAGER